MNWVSGHRTQPAAAHSDGADASAATAIHVNPSRAAQERVCRAMRFEVFPAFWSTCGHARMLTLGVPSSYHALCAHGSIPGIATRLGLAQCLDPGFEARLRVLDLDSRTTPSFHGPGHSTVQSVLLKKLETTLTSVCRVGA
jgi:hypothetical protein